ncbi:MAG: SulP family inorganic anion transporter [Thermodesulfobacteriota bacterium]
MLHNIFPFLKWFEHYHREYVKADLFAGLTVALVLIPQSMAYAQLAGLPSYYGLYASILPPAVAALFGSSRQLATGPVAVVSVMTAVALEPLATAGSQQYIAYAILLAAMVGLFQFFLGVFRLGLVVNLLSHPVINGFTNAAAIFIATSQLSKIFGVQVDKAELHYETVYRILKSTYHFMHWPTFLMALVAFIVMYTLAKTAPRLPNVLIAVALTTVLSWATDFEHNATVAAEHIVYPEAKAAMAAFNRATATIPALLEKRSRLNKQKAAALKAEDELTAIDMLREIALVEYQIRARQSEAMAQRREIRAFRMEGTRTNGVPDRYYPQKRLPSGLEGDGHTWRIDINESSLDMGALRLVSGGLVVGNIPQGLPRFSLPKIEPHIILELLPFGITIALLGFMEAISVAKAMAARTGQRIDPNQELIGQGLANLLGALGKSYPNAGSFSRSAVNLQAGAISGMSNVFASIVVVATLFLFTPLLYHLPQSVLAAIIMMAVAGLVNVKGFVHAWRARWYDGTISVIVFVATLVFAPHLDRGIFVGVALSLMVFLYKSMRPKVVDLSLGGDFALHDAVSFGLQECQYIAVVRFDGPLFFANASYLEDQIRMRRRTKKSLKHIIVAAESINDIDASGEEALSLTVDRVRSANIDISLSGVHQDVRAVLERTHLLAKIGEDHIFPSISRAIKAVHKQTHRGGDEKNCPLTTVCTLQDQRVDAVAPRR